MLCGLRIKSPLGARRQSPPTRSHCHPRKARSPPSSANAAKRRWWCRKEFPHRGRSHPACKLATAITPAQNSARFEGSRGVMRGPRLPPALRRQRPAWRGAANRPLVRHARGDRCNKGRMRRSPYNRDIGQRGYHIAGCQGWRHRIRRSQQAADDPRLTPDLGLDRRESSDHPYLHASLYRIRRIAISATPKRHLPLATNFPVRSKFAGARSRLTWQDPMGNR